mmetsp:Transcript_11449/g.19363  ORF Transcript_11449/g.19363 Transcript_11449/m.19363 type:complete len:259 (-) Transcript_11449:445-1221(-)
MVRQSGSEAPLDFCYSTFWNDFSHYSVYQHGDSTTPARGEVETEIDYSDVETQQKLFEERSKFIDYVSEGAEQQGAVTYSEGQFSNQRVVESFLVADSPSKVRREMFAHVPQDFNLDIEVNGSIRGVNLGDSKFLGSQAKLITRGEDSTIKARRVRTDVCEIEVGRGGLEIGSYLESQDMKVTVRNAGNVSIGKKIGVANFGEIVQYADDSHPKLFRAGSVFSNMAQLPPKGYAGYEGNIESEYADLVSQPIDKGLFI